MSEPTDTFTLTSGAKVSRVFVAMTMLVLERWAADKPLVLYDAFMMATDSGYIPFGVNGKDIEDAGFTKSGVLKRDVASIVKCAVEMNGFDFTLKDPVARVGSCGRPPPECETASAVEPA